MKNFKIVLILAGVFLLVSCSVLKVTDPEWAPQKEGITLHLKADNKLNEKNGKAYTLYLVVYQLTSPNSFNQIADSSNGMQKLLSSKIFDESVSSVKSLVIYPGTDVTHKIDRAKGTQYVAITAGYMNMVKERMVRVYEVPVKVKTRNLVDMTQTMEADNLLIDLKLGSKQIEDVKGEK